MINGKPRAARFPGARAIRKDAVVLTLCALLIAAPTPLRTINASPLPQTEPALRLEDLERMALRNNPTVAQAEDAVRAAEGRRVQAGLMPNPIIGYAGEELSLRAFGQKSEHYIFAEQEVPLGGKLKKSGAIYARERMQAQAEAAAQKQRVLNAVRT